MPLRKQYPCYVLNEALTPNADLEVRDKFTGEIVTRVALADGPTIDRAITGGLKASAPMRKLSPYQRQQILAHCTQRFEERRDELAETLCIEAGKPIKDSRVEVTRLIDTFRIATEEATRFGGEVIPLAITQRTEGYRGFTQRVPIGLCSFISPFNFPLNLVAHKIAPAIAAGCPFILKPASLTPIGALLIGEVLAETDLPKGAFSILPCRRDGADLFTTDERFKLLSFTGSAAVGWRLKAKAGKKKVILELGGNAACIVEPDADIDDAVQRNIVGAFYQSGQSCISVQRLYVHEKIYEKFRAAFCEKAAKLKMGNPREEETFIGPMISEEEAERVEKWMDAAGKRGGKVLVGGSRKGVMVPATVLEGVPRDVELYREEAFGPVVILEKYSEFKDAIQRVNEGRYGLQAGVFTKDLHKALSAWDELEVGGVVIGDVPSWRVDNMPYGGVKDSGLGREGIRYAMEEMSETRLMIVRSSPS